MSKSWVGKMIPHDRSLTPLSVNIQLGEDNDPFVKVAVTDSFDEAMRLWTEAQNYVLEKEIGFFHDYIEAHKKYEEKLDDHLKNPLFYFMTEQFQFTKLKRANSAGPHFNTYLPIYMTLNDEIIFGRDSIDFSEAGKEDRYSVEIKPQIRAVQRKETLAFSGNVIDLEKLYQRPKSKGKMEYEVWILNHDAINHYLYKIWLPFVSQRVSRY